MARYREAHVGGCTEATLQVREDGSTVLRSTEALRWYPARLTDCLEQWAAEAPDRSFVARRGADGAWQHVGYAQMLQRVQAVAQALLDAGLSRERPLAILSGNDVEHLTLALAAMWAGVPYIPVSTAYSLVSQDFGKLRHILALAEPGLVFASGPEYARAIAATVPADLPVVLAQGQLEGRETRRFDGMLATVPGEALAAAHARVDADTVVKLLFTSGSTREPKGVITTHRMLCSNQQMIRQCLRFLADEPPVLLDWLPWNHVFGGSHNVGIVLYNGGTLYLDDGKPAPGLIEKSVARLREISPTIYFNVPRGFDALIPFLETDDALRANFFRRLQMIFYAAAALPQHLWEKLEALSIRERGLRTVMVSAWGATETAPMVTTVHFPIERAGVVGLPAPGTEIKMVPAQGKLELRVRGPNVTPGYWKRPDLTHAAFDEEGYYRIGDAGRLADETDPSRGLVFDGRIAEDFKLMSGVWVHVGALRVKALECLAPVAQDIVVTGHDREEIGFLVFAHPGGCRSLCPDLPSDTPLATVLADPRVRTQLQKGLAALRTDAPASSTHATRALLMAEPPSIDDGEITDKGYINQRAVLARRAALVEALYAEPPGAPVIFADAAADAAPAPERRTA